MDRAARDRAPARPYRLYDRVAVRRHRLPAFHLHDARARNGAFDLCAPPRTGVGMAPAGRAPGAGSGAASGGQLRLIPEPFGASGRYPSMSASRLVHVDDSRSEEHTSELQSLMRISYA